MFARVLLGSVLLCVLAFASSAEEPKDKKEPKETELKPTLVFLGSHSAILDEKFDVVTNEKDWQRLWKAHRGDADPRLFSERDRSFDINFDTRYIVAIFFSDAPYSGTVTPRQRGDTIAIGYEWGGFQRAGRDRDRRPDLAKAKDATTAPYAFLVLPKPVKTVIIEKDVQTELGNPPAWKEQARFPAPADKK